jgi:hypothetical protein
MAVNLRRPLALRQPRFPGVPVFRALPSERNIVPRGAIRRFFHSLDAGTGADK